MDVHGPVDRTGPGIRHQARGRRVDPRRRHGCAGTRSQAPREVQSPCRLVSGAVRGRLGGPGRRRDRQGGRWRSLRRGHVRARGLRGPPRPSLVRPRRRGQGIRGRPGRRMRSARLGAGHERVRRHHQPGTNPRRGGDPRHQRLHDGATRQGTGTSRGPDWVVHHRHGADRQSRRRRHLPRLLHDLHQATSPQLHETHPRRPHPAGGSAQPAHRSRPRRFWLTTCAAPSSPSGRSSRTSPSLTCGVGSWGSPST